MTLDRQIMQLAERLHAVHSHEDAAELCNIVSRMHDLWGGTDEADLADTMELISAHAAVAATIIRSHTVPPFF
ncbi:hypothetical protein [Streptomyces sp. NRRL F-2664]|uniref:hypothetical protein n=1 Tax=Streptomyces sp. NRRL F-2664 TaxID=1463842 RepID=UPI00131EAC0B|nr:hypothetical protein [Streptomyces sp. NRRL F-2664]